MQKPVSDHLGSPSESATPPADLLEALGGKATFGRLSVVGWGDWYVSPSKQKIRRVVCVCTCGNHKSILPGNLRNGHAASCGCLRREAHHCRGRVRKPLDLLESMGGRTRFGRLTPVAWGELEPYGNNGKRLRRVVCKCDCGTLKKVEAGSLRAGVTRSCGCLRIDVPYTRTPEALMKVLGGKTEFGNLRVLGWGDRETLGESGREVNRALCECACGNILNVRPGSLRSGSSRSCGCSRRKKKHPDVPEAQHIEAVKAASGIRGVAWIAKQRCFRAYIDVQRERVHLGSFQTVQEAADARLQAEQRVKSGLHAR